MTLRHRRLDALRAQEGPAVERSILVADLGDLDPEALSSHCATMWRWHQLSPASISAALSQQTITGTLPSPARSRRSAATMRGWSRSRMRL